MVLLTVIFDPVFVVKSILPHLAMVETVSSSVPESTQFFLLMASLFGGLQDRQVCARLLSWWDKLARINGIVILGCALLPFLIYCSLLSRRRVTVTHWLKQLDFLLFSFYHILNIFFWRFRDGLSHHLVLGSSLLRRCWLLLWSWLPRRQAMRLNWRCLLIGLVKANIFGWYRAIKLFIFVVVLHHFVEHLLLLNTDTLISTWWKMFWEFIHI